MVLSGSAMAATEFAGQLRDYEPRYGNRQSNNASIFVLCLMAACGFPSHLTVRGLLRRVCDNVVGSK